MAWLTESELRNKFNIQSGRFASQIESAITSAALTLQRGVESSVYAEAIDDNPPPADPELLRYSSVVDAHSYLTMWYLVGNVGNRLSEAGFIKSQQDASSPGLGSKVITNSYLTPKELADMRDEYLANARASLGDYGVIVVAVEEPVSEQDLLNMRSLAWF